MSEVKSSSVRSAHSEMIARLISAGYLQPEQRNDRDAITNAFGRFLRGTAWQDPRAAPLVAKSTLDGERALALTPTKHSA
jgi:hypothetical protein